jgi:COP9 signalosome complex subunit 3
LQCLTAPSKALSAVQINAYKKYVLVSLIHYGELVELPQKLTSPVVYRTVGRACQSYAAVAAAFRSGIDDLRKVLKENEEEFLKDNNLGLVKQTQTVLISRRITRLTNTYMTMPLKEIAANADLKSADEAEEAVYRMVENGEIYATISQRDGIISFQDDPEQFDTVDMVQKLDQKLRTAIDLKEKLDKMDAFLQTHRNYVAKVRSCGACFSPRHLRSH